MFGLKFKEIDLNKLPLKKIVIIGQFLVIIFLVRSCHLKELTLSSKGLEIEMFEKKTNKLGEELYLQKQMIVDRDKSLEKELLKNSELTKLNEQVKFEAQTMIENIEAQYYGSNGTEVVTIHDTVRVPGGTVKDTSFKAIKVGTKFVADTSKWYKISGKIGEKGVSFDTINFKSSFTLNIGEKRVKGYKGWLLGKKEPMVELINSNPYTKIDAMKNIKFVDRKWYDNGWVKFGAGVLIGGGLILIGK